jgi:hypothetical protein
VLHKPQGARCRHGEPKRVRVHDPSPLTTPVLAQAIRPDRPGY